MTLIEKQRQFGDEDVIKELVSVVFKAGLRFVSNSYYIYFCNQNVHYSALRMGYHMRKYVKMEVVFHRWRCSSRGTHAWLVSPFSHASPNWLSWARV